MIFIELLASDLKSEIKAAVWQLPDDFDSNTIVDDQSNSHQPLDLKCHLSTGESVDVKR